MLAWQILAGLQRRQRNCWGRAQRRRGEFLRRL